MVLLPLDVLDAFWIDVEAAELKAATDFLRWYLSGAGATTKEGWDVEWVDAADDIWDVEEVDIGFVASITGGGVGGRMEEKEWDRWLLREEDAEIAAFVFAADVVPIEERDNAEVEFKLAFERAKEEGLPEVDKSSVYAGLKKTDWDLKCCCCCWDCGWGVGGWEIEYCCIWL